MSKNLPYNLVRSFSSQILRNPKIKIYNEIDSELNLKSAVVNFAANKLKFLKQISIDNCEISFFLTKLVSQLSDISHSQTQTVYL